MEDSFQKISDAAIIDKRHPLPDAVSRPLTEEHTRREKIQATFPFPDRRYVCGSATDSGQSLLLAKNHHLMAYRPYVEHGFECAESLM